MLNIVNKIEDKNAVEVILRPGTAPEPFFEDTKFIPASKGFVVFVDGQKTFPLRQAARVVAKLNINNLILKTEIPFEIEDAIEFCTSYEDLDEKNLKNPKTVVLDFPDADTYRVNFVVEMVSQLRHISNLPANILKPQRFAQMLCDFVKSLSKSAPGKFSFKIINSKSHDYLNLVGIRAVGGTSDEKGCMAIIDYVPQGGDPKSPPDIALVGKGITFDSGGYDLKPPRFMDTMRTDKIGAVNLTGVFTLAAASARASKHIRLYLCCAQNMVSDKSMVPGDILVYPNGIKVEVGNTDAEGRLVLADGIIKAVESGAKLIITEATLTGAAKMALGRDINAMVCRNQKNALELSAVFEANGELIWQFPLEEFHNRYISSSRADICNCAHGDNPPGVMTAAAFLSKFIPEDIDWIHIDLSAAYLQEESPFYAKGPTGCTILPLALWIKHCELKENTVLKSQEQSEWIAHFEEQ